MVQRQLTHYTWTPGESGITWHKDFGSGYSAHVDLASDYERYIWYLYYNHHLEAYGYADSAGEAMERADEWAKQFTEASARARAVQTRGSIRIAPYRRPY